MYVRMIAGTRAKGNKGRKYVLAVCEIVSEASRIRK
jgi:hypothetical protein